MIRVVDILGQDIKEGDFGLVSWYSRWMFPVIITQVHLSDKVSDYHYLRFAWIKEGTYNSILNSKSISHATLVPRDFKCTSFVKSDINLASDEIKKYYEVIYKHVKRI